MNISDTDLITGIGEEISHWAGEEGLLGTDHGFLGPPKMSQTTTKQCSLFKQVGNFQKSRKLQAANTESRNRVARQGYHGDGPVLDRTAEPRVGDQLEKSQDTGRNRLRELRPQDESRVQGSLCSYL